MESRKCKVEVEDGYGMRKYDENPDTQFSILVSKHNTEICSICLQK